MSHCPARGQGGLYEKTTCSSEFLFRRQIQVLPHIVMVEATFTVHLSFKHMLLHKRLSEHQTNKICKWALFFRQFVSLVLQYLIPECQNLGATMEAHRVSCQNSGAQWLLNHGVHLKINCNPGVLVGNDGKHQADENGKMQISDGWSTSIPAADWFVFIIRKTTSTVVILQAGPWAFSWLTLRSTEFYSTLSEFHCDVQLEKAVHGIQKRIGKIS